MPEIFDYTKCLIHYNGCSYPFITIEEGNYEHIVSVIALNKQLYDDEHGYSSRLAQWIDEKIIYFVSEKEDLQRFSEDLLKEIYG